MPTPPTQSFRARVWAVLRETARGAWDDRVSRLSAALAYYAVFAVAPLLVIGVRVAALFFGEQRSRDEAGRRLRQLFGPAPARALQDLLDHAAATHAAGNGSALVGAGLLLYVSATLFFELRDAMNTIWEVEPAPDRTWARRIGYGMGPFVMVMVAGLIVLASLTAGPALAAADPHVNGPAWVHHGLRVGASLVVFTVAFGLIYKVLPDVTLRWADAVVGAAVTAVLFTAGELSLQWYLGRPGMLNVYGTAGSVGVLLLWVYYSAHVLFLGAEFTQAYACQMGRRIEPARGAVRVPSRRRQARRPPATAGQPEP